MTGVRADVVIREVSPPPPPWWPLSGTHHWDKTKDKNNEARWPASSGISREGSQLCTFPPASNPTWKALQFPTRRRQEIAHGFQADELASESSGNKAQVKQSHLQRAAQGIDYPASTSEEGLGRLYRGDSRILIESQVAIFASLERIWACNFPKWWAAVTLRFKRIVTALSTRYCKRTFFSYVPPNTQLGIQRVESHISVDIIAAPLICFWFSIALV